MASGCSRWGAWIVAAIAFAATSPARAAPPPLHRPPPKRVYVVALESEAVSEVERRDVEDAVARGARGDADREVLSPDRSAQLERPDAILARGDDALAKAREKIADFRLDQAITLLEETADIYRQNLPDLALRDGNVDALFHVYRELSVAQFLEGDEEGAGRSLAHCLVLRPHLEYDPKLFPPQMRPFVMSAGLLAEEMGTGSLEVTVKGGKAEVYVNGIERGEAPVVVEGLRSGPNVVNAVGLGTPTATAEAEVEGGGRVTVEVEILPPPVAIPTNVAAVRPDLGRSKASKRMRKLRKQLGVEALIVVVPSRTPVAVELQGYVYDLRTGRLAAKATATDGVELGAALLASADWGILDQKAASDGPPIWDPDHRYFWHAVGAAAGVVTVVTIGVIAARSGGLSPGERVVVFGLGTKF